MRVSYSRADTRSLARHFENNGAKSTGYGRVRLTSGSYLSRSTGPLKGVIMKIIAIYTDDKHKVKNQVKESTIRQRERIYDYSALLPENDKTKDIWYKTCLTPEAAIKLQRNRTGLVMFSVSLGLEI